MAEPKSSRKIGLSAGLVSALAAALMMIAVHTTHSTWSPLQVLFHRSLLAIIVLYPWIHRDFSKLFTRTALIIWIRAGFGTFSIIIYFYCLQIEAPGKVAALFATTPIGVILLAMIFLHERIDTARAIAFATVIAGIILLKAPSDSSIPLATLGLCLAGAFLRACSYICLKKATATFSSTSLVWSISLGLLMASSVYIGTTPGETFAFTAVELWAVSLLSLLMQITLTISYKHLPAGHAVMLEETGTLWTVLFGAALLGQYLGMIEILGIVCIVGGNLAVQLRRKKQ